MSLKISNQQVRQLWLESNLLINESRDKLDLLQLIKDLGFVQLDTIQNVTRAHHHILWSRNKNYKEEMIDELIKNRELFEHFTHDASFIPTEFYPYWNIQYQRMKEKIDKSKYYKNILDESGIKSMLSRFEEEGSLNTKDFDSDSIHKSTLEYLWYSGVLGTSHRINFRKYYNIKENIIPLEHLNRKLLLSEQIDWLCKNALKRLGIANAKEKKNFWDVLTLKEVNTWIKENSDKLVEVLWEDTDGNYHKSFAFNDIENKLDKKVITNKEIKIINPFDPSIRDRVRLKKIFGFEYKIEIFVPKEKRDWGYYVYPLLFQDKFIGRIELKANKKTKELEVINFWHEKDILWDEEKQKMLDIELSNFASFVDIDNIVYNKKVKL